MPRRVSFKAIIGTFRNCKQPNLADASNVNLCTCHQRTEPKLKQLSDQHSSITLIAYSQYSSLMLQVCVNTGHKQNQAHVNACSAERVSNQITRNCRRMSMRTVRMLRCIQQDHVRLTLLNVQVRYRLRLLTNRRMKLCHHKSMRMVLAKR